MAVHGIGILPGHDPLHFYKADRTVSCRSPRAIALPLRPRGPMLAEFWSELRYRLRSMFRRAAVERELDEELRFHLEHETAKHVRSGMSSADAAWRARLAFGGMSRIKEDTRDTHGIASLENLVRDLRYALRGIRSRPGFAAVIMLTLALGVGVNAAMFGIVDRVLLRPPAYLIDPASVNRLYDEWTLADGKRGANDGFEYTRFTAFARENRTLSQVAGFAYRTMAVGRGTDTRVAMVGIVTGNFFEFFNVHALIGRLFGRDDDQVPNGHLVAVLGNAYWQAQYGGRRDVIGTRIIVGKATYTIIGVAPPGFEGISDQRAPAVFVPVTSFAIQQDATYYRDYAWDWLDVLVRRKPGVSASEAANDLTRIYLQTWQAQREIEPALPDARAAKPVILVAPTQGARGPLGGPQPKVIAAIGGVALIVLLIACANAANLLLARALRRHREFAVRRAIGGSRSRLIQQTLIETLVLCGFGTVAGVIGAQLASGPLRNLLLGDVDPQPVATDARTIVFAVALAGVATLLSGLAPALRAGRGDLADSLRAGMRDSAYRQSRVRNAILVGQTALAVVLLIGAGLFARSLRAVRAQPLGYDVDHIEYVETSMRDVKLSRNEQAALADRLSEAARAMPEVMNATPIVSVPFWFDEARSLHIAGIDSLRKLGRFALQAGSPDYFAMMGTRILRGRAFGSDDRAGAPPVVVVSESMANVLWKNEDPIGKCIRIGADTMPCTTVIGVAENIQANSFTASVEFTYYLPMAQYRERFGAPSMLALFVRTRGDAATVSAALRPVLQRVMPGSSYITVRPLHEIVDPSMRSWVSGARMFGAFGALALALAGVGLYAVIAFGVAQRTHELGIRIALGARTADVVRLIVLESARITVSGAALGTVVAWFAGRWVADLLFKVSPHDPAVFAAISFLLLAVGATASALPAVRAARVDPNRALRVE